MKRKNIFVILGTAAIMLLIVGGYYLYCSYHPDLQISIGGTFGNEEHYIEHVSIAYSTRYNIPLTKSIEENLFELSDWNNQIVTELVMGNYVDPIYITVFGEVKDGKTTIRYEGFVTTTGGERKNYREEMIFDFVLVPGEELLK